MVLSLIWIYKHWPPPPLSTIKIKGGGFFPICKPTGPCPVPYLNLAGLLKLSLNKCTWCIFAAYTSAGNLCIHLFIFFRYSWFIMTIWKIIIWLLFTDSLLWFTHSPTQNPQIDHPSTNVHKHYLCTHICVHIHTFVHKPYL